MIELLEVRVPAAGDVAAEGSKGSLPGAQRDLLCGGDIRKGNREDFELSVDVVGGADRLFVRTVVMVKALKVCFSETAGFVRRLERLLQHRK